MRKIRKVAIVGVNSSGKTTVAEAMARGFELSLIKDMVRTVAAMLNIPGDDPSLSHTQRVEWVRGVLWWEIALEKTFESFIADASLITFWAYIKLWFNQTSDTIRIFENIVYEHAKRYTHIIYLPPLLPLEGNGFRSPDLSYRDRADEMIKMLCGQWFDYGSKKVKVVEHVDINSRIKECSAFLSTS